MIHAANYHRVVPAVHEAADLVLTELARRVGIDSDDARGLRLGLPNRLDMWASGMTPFRVVQAIEEVAGA